MGTLAYVSDAELNTDVESEIINVTDAGTAFVDAGVIVLNSVDSGPSVAVSPGDELKVKITSSTDFVDSRYSTLDLNGELFVFQVITKRDPSLIYTPAYKTEPRYSTLGQTWTPQNQNNKIGKFNVTSDSVSEFVLDHTVSGTGPIASETSYAFVADFYANVVYRVALDTGTTLQRITGFDKPADIVYGQGPVAEDRAVPYIINYGNSTVSRLSLTDFTITGTISLASGASPIKAVYDDDQGALWTANFNNNTVSKISINRETFAHTITVYNVDNGPHDILLDGDNIYVVCALSDSVVRIHKVTEDITSLTVGEVPWSITESDSFLFVTNTVSKTVSKISKTTFTVDDTYTDFGDLPDSCIVVGNSLFVNDFENATMYEKSITTGSLLDTHTWSSSRTYAVGVDRDTQDFIYSALFYPNTPTRFAARDYDLDNAVVFSPLQSLDLNETVVSNTITVSGIDQILPLSIQPTPATAELYKNGSPEGTVTTVENGDTFYVEAVSSGDYDTSVITTVTIGDVVSSFDIQTVALTAVPEGFTFPSRFNQALNTYVNGDTHTIEKIDAPVDLATTVTPDTGTTDLVKNEVLSGTSVTYNLDDTISIRDYTSLGYQVTNIYFVDTGIFELPWVTQTTLDPDSKHLNPSQINALPVEFNSTTGELDPTEVTIYSTDLTSEITTTIVVDSALPGSPDPAEYNNTDDYILFADYLGNRVIRLDADGNPVQEITGLVNPYDVSFIPKVADNTVSTKVVVTSSGSDEVYIYNRDTWTVDHVVSVGARPLGVTGGQELVAGFEFYVCCYDDDKVQRVHYNGSTFSITDIALPAGSGPVACTLHTSGFKVFVSCFKTDKMVVIDSSSIVGTVDTDVRPISIASAPDDVFVANMASNTVSWYTKDGNFVGRVDTYSAIPIDVTVSGTSLYVTHMESSTTQISEYDISVVGSPTLQRTFNVPNNDYLYGSAVSNGKLLTLRQYPARDSRTIQSLPNPTTLASIPNVTEAPIGVTQDTAAFYATGANNYPIRMRTPGLFDSRFVVNGQEVGIDTWVYPTDEIVLRVDLVNVPGYLHNVPVIFEGKVYDVTVSTEPDRDPNPLIFAPVGGLYTFEYGYSNVVTIAGMTVGVTSPVVANPFVGIVLNGTDITNADETQSTSFTITNGDELQLYGLPGRPYGSTAIHTIDVHGIDYSFEVSSFSLNNPEYQNFYIYDAGFLVVLSAPEVYETRAFNVSASSEQNNSIVLPGFGSDYILTQGLSYQSNASYAYDAETFNTVDINLVKEYQSFTLNSIDMEPETIYQYTYSDFVDLRPATGEPFTRLFVDTHYDVDKNTVLSTDTSFDRTEKSVFILSSNYQPMVNGTIYVYDIPNNRFDLDRFDRRRTITAEYDRDEADSCLFIDVSDWYKWWERRHSEFVGTTYERHYWAQVLHGITLESYGYEQKLHGITVIKDLVYNPILYDMIFDTGILYGIYSHGTTYDGYSVNITTSPVVEFDYTPSAEMLLHGTDQDYMTLLGMLNYGVVNYDYTRKKYIPHSMPSPVKEAFVRQQGVSIYAVLKFEADGTSIHPAALTPIKDYDPWYDNTPLYSVTQKHYFTSQQDAINDGVSNGYLEEDIITVEVEPGGWIWGYKVIDYTNACDGLGFRVRGWIRGG